MELFSNNNYFQYIIAIICILFVSQSYYNNCKKNISSKYIKKLCSILFFLSLLIIFFIIVQSIKYTNKKTNIINRDDNITRNTIDFTLLFIISCITIITLYILFIFKPIFI